MLIDATHKVDVMMLDAQQCLLENESLAARDRFVARVEDAALMSKGGH